MILTKDDLDRDWRWIFLHCKNTAVAKAEILALLSKEPDNKYQWSEQDIYEQMRKIIRKYE